jgi:hypothetical protein
MIDKKLLKKEGVVSVGKGLKVKNGKKTNQVCKVVGVQEKKPLSDIKKKDIIPRKTDDGMITDVIQVGTIKALENIDRLRPCPPGYSIGHPTITAGTLGCYVLNKDNVIVLLSNNHVIAASNNAQIGDIIIQPGTHDGGQLGTPENPIDDFAILENFIPVEMMVGLPDCEIVKWFVLITNLAAKFTGSRHRIMGYMDNQAAENLVDAAIAIPLNLEYINPEIPEIGIPDGLIDLELGMEVHKNGRTTGYRVGTVSQTDMTVNVQYGEMQFATFTDQIAIDGDFSAGGDSGSAVLNGTKLGGLLFAGGDNITICNKINNVFDLLELSLPNWSDIKYINAK